jgi:hypothetical protein
MGGRCNQPTGCEVEIDEEFYLGNGYYGYEIKLPSGKTRVIEKTSGAIVGDTIKEVRNDITEGDKKVMEDQVIHACKESKEVRVISQEEFWKIYDKNK